MVKFFFQKVKSNNGSMQQKFQGIPQIGGLHYFLSSYLSVLTSTKIMSSYLRASNLQLERKLEHLHSC
jgi:hypothetical protein